jgi:hypothetical protein
MLGEETLCCLGEEPLGPICCLCSLEGDDRRKMTIWMLRSGFKLRGIDVNTFVFHLVGTRLERLIFLYGGSI